MGAMDLGRLFYTKMVLTNAAREGANYLAYFPEDANNGFMETFIAIYDEANSSTVEIFDNGCVLYRLLHAGFASGSDDHENSGSHF